MPRRRAYNDYFGYGGFPPYVSVAERRLRAAAAAEALARGGARKGPKTRLAPVARIRGSKIAHSFWGRAWCDNLESYSDYANRLPRGRSYVRHGAVVDLQIDRGRIAARVSGSDLYEITIDIKPLAAARWSSITSRCAGGIDSLVALLRGDLSDGIMQVVTDHDAGLFPAPREITLDCSCPDWADMCKHVAAALYGVGARLDDQPRLLFSLRGVDHMDLIGGAAAAAARPAAAPAGARVLDPSDLGAVFGIEIETKPAARVSSPASDTASKSPLADGKRGRSVRATGASADSPGKSTLAGGQRGKGVRVMGASADGARGPTGGARGPTGGARGSKVKIRGARRGKPPTASKSPGHKKPTVRRRRGSLGALADVLEQMIRNERRRTRRRK